MNGEHDPDHLRQLPVRLRPITSETDIAGTVCSVSLHQRTHRMIGSQLRLVRSTAISAVLDGTEKITKSLDTVEADIASQSPRPLAT